MVPILREAESPFAHTRVSGTRPPSSSGTLTNPSTREPSSSSERSETPEQVTPKPWWWARCGAPSWPTPPTGPMCDELQDIPRRYVSGYARGTVIYARERTNVGLCTLVHEVTHVEQHLEYPDFAKRHEVIPKRVAEASCGNNALCQHQFNRYEMEADNNADRVCLRRCCGG
jgi:hypothetical protein